MNKKNLLWLLSLLMMVQVSFVSCNKDDDDEDDVVPISDLKTAIIGTWKELSDELYMDNKVVKEESIYHDDINYYEFEFKSDGTYLDRKFKDGKEVENYDYDGTWTLDGDKITFSNEPSSVRQVTIKGNTLILSYDDGSFTDESGLEHKFTIVCTYKKQ